MNTNTLSTFSHDLEFIIHKGRHTVLDASWCCERAKLPYSRLYFIKDGAGKLALRGREIPLLRGHVYFIPAELEFSYSCERLEKLFFHFSLLNFERYDITAGLDSIYEMEYSGEAYEALGQAVSSDNCFDYLRMQSVLLSVLLGFKSRFSLPDKKIKRYSPLVEAIIGYVKGDPKITVRTKDISDAFFVSESKIRNDFLRETGIPLGRYVDDMVFMKAKEMLADKSLSLSEISGSLGFCDQFYFSRRFKEKLSMTPTEFRKGVS